MIIGHRSYLIAIIDIVLFHYPADKDRSSIHQDHQAAPIMEQSRTINQMDLKYKQIVIRLLPLLLPALFDSGHSENLSRARAKF